MRRSILSLAVAGLIGLASGAVAAGDPGVPLIELTKRFDVATVQAEAVTVTLVEQEGRTVLRLSSKASPACPAVTFPAPTGNWDLSAARYLELDLKNSGGQPVEFTCWALSPGGWGGAGTYPTHPEGRLALQPGARLTARIDLHARYPGPDVCTKVIDPARVSGVRIVFHPARRRDDLRQSAGQLEITAVRTTGKAPQGPHDLSGRLIVPAVTGGEPPPGKRVRQVLPGYEKTELSHVLYLPRDWKPGRRYPVIVEYAGNEFYWKFCHSTGRAEQGTIGYGMSKGERFLWLNLPFVSDDGRREQVSGWGSADKTAKYCLEAVRHVCESHGGDPAAVFLTGFSRGGIACGYIGLRNDEIADVWLGFHAVDGGDGQAWNAADKGVRERVARMKGRPAFLTKGKAWQEHLKAAGVPFTAVDPRLGSDVHVDGALLEDRPSTVACREWLERVLKERPGTHAVRGRVTGPDGKGLAGVRVRSGPTHFTLTDADGRYELRGLIDGLRKVTASRDGFRFLPAEREVTLADKDVGEVDFAGEPRR